MTRSADRLPAVRADERGFTLLEITVTLIVAVIVAAVAVSASVRAFETAKVKSEVSNLHELVSATLALRSGNGYPDRPIPILRSMGLLPPAYADMGGDELVNAWGGALQLTSPNLHQLAAVLDGLPTSACTALARSFAMTDRYQVTAGGQQIQAHNIGQASAACQSDRNSIRVTHNL